ncbi:Lrp/AsnC ligand binding domain-containing protein [Streptomyces xylophagus]|uniref:Lrp/AsnC ligand binding domain-containing protein n=1 Tax=Streptomyces xylophagus TaxID=285514 RepID=UPI001F45C6F8|nr:Lrp/AsnC ligand binding domain-containing protein [Streptomyces xylophagus]
MSQALTRAAQTPEVISILRVTGEDCLLLDVHCSHAERLEQVVDALADTDRSPPHSSCGATHPSPCRRHRQRPDPRHLPPPPLTRRPSA